MARSYLTLRRDESGRTDFGGCSIDLDKVRAITPMR
jgi:hypothetical protein